MDTEVSPYVGRSASVCMGRLTIVIQAGGNSARMGRDKALIPFQGMPLTEYIHRQVNGLGDDAILITNQPEAYRELGLPLYPDVFPQMGALGGLYSAIYHAPQEYCLVLACDMPFVNRPLLQYMIALAPQFDAVIPRLSEGDFAEPFRAIYRKRCLGPIKTAINSGQRRVISFFEEVNIRFVDRPEIERFDPEARSFFNINTPDDLVEAERLAAQLH